jgi:hypothetical protein
MAIIFRDVALNSTFSELFIDDDDGNTWYRLWTGDAAGENGSFVDTSFYNDFADGWIAEADLPLLRADYAQYDDTHLWIKPWREDTGGGEWVSGAIDFTVINDVTPITEVTGDTPFADMFTDLNTASEVWYQFWAGNADGTEGAFADTTYGNGWVESADLTSELFSAPAGGESTELWVCSWTAAARKTDWEHWTVTSAALVEGETFTLTTGDDTLEGTDGDDHFYGIYDGDTFSAQNTFNDGDILGGAGGIDMLHIDHFEDVAITPPDTLWTGISGIEKIVMNTTGSGAQTITTGTNFNTAFASGGVDMSTTTTGDGAITINMDSFTGTAKLTANSVAGAIDISGVNFTQINITTTGAGAQTITSTGTVDVIVNATSSEGATSITTGTGEDTITLYATAAEGDNTITAGKGADTINLYTNFASIDTIVQAGGDSMASTANTTTDNIAAGQTITFGNSLDIINNFGVNDRLDVGTDGAAVSGIGMDEASFTPTKTIFFSGTYDGNLFTIAADGEGTDTLLFDTTAADDTDIATADTWILLQGVSSTALSAETFI